MAQTDGYAGLGPVAPTVPEGARRSLAGAPGDLHRVHRPGRRRPGTPLDRGGSDGVLSDDRFVDNLIDMVIGAMSAPSGGG